MSRVFNYVPHADYGTPECVVFGISKAHRVANSSLAIPMTDGGFR
jgi:hypothetical protein